ncbi:MAG: hypothetical protein IPG00_20090 [Saprospiraceae bacterium]|nr:hypothetical protein [Saprospiraceae bacterium]
MKQSKKLKRSTKINIRKIKKGYSESGEVIIANKNNDNKTTEKIDTKKNLEDELKLLIFTKNVNGVQDFLDKSTKGNIIELRKLVKSQRKYWLDYVDLRKESVFKFGQNNWGYRADDKQREILLLFLVAVGDLKEINSQWDVYSAFQEILNNDRFRNLIRNSKPTWVEEFLLGQIRRNNWSVVPYKALRFLEKEGIIKFNPELYALNLANQRDHKNNSKESEFIKSFLEDSVALTRDIPLLFEYETNINNNSFHIQNNDKFLY